jgi:hypothetical protein
VLPREGAEAVTGALVRGERLVVGIVRIGGDLLRDEPNFMLDRGTVGGIAEQRFDPTLGTVPAGNVVVEQELAEQDAGADVGERLEGKDPVWSLEASRDSRILTQDTVDDLADRLVDQRNPQFVETSHGGSMPSREVP